ncbi:MAG: DNA polymerase IV [Bifidobacteriaceae bacterium]|nr:DNA polymerase IV [Bifidobacteriaceae bacterium]
MSKGLRINRQNLYFGDDDDGCNILHIDMDAFFASVEIAKNPALKGFPVIVGGSRKHPMKGVVSAANYEAREFGVHSAMPIFQAKRLCPKGIFLPVSMGEYGLVSAKAMNIFRSFTHKVEPASVDEAYLDVSPAKKLFGSPVTIAKEIRKRVADELNVTCSIGVAKNKFVAKLASTNIKPDGLLLIPLVRTQEFLDMLAISQLPGIGPKTADKLEKWGITEVLDLHDYNAFEISKILESRLLADHLMQLSRGESNSEVKMSRIEKSIGNEITFNENISSTNALLKELLFLSDKTVGRLKYQQFTCKTVSVKIKTFDFKSYAKSETLESETASINQVYNIAKVLLRDLRKRVGENTPIRLLGIRLSSLKAVKIVNQQEFFTESDEDKKRHKLENAESAMDSIRGKFGKTSVKYGV